MMKRYISLLLLCIATNMMTDAQNSAPTEEPEPTPTIVQGLQTAQGFTVFNRLVEACGLQVELSKIRDEAYEEAFLTGRVRDLQKHPTEQIGTIPEHRYYGFTIFAESDAIWEELIGKTANQISVKDVMNKLIKLGIYPNAKRDENYTDEDNLINQFTTYHILPEKLTPNRLVIHYNENGYYWKTSGTNYSVPVYEYFTTMGKRRLLKIFQSAESVQSDPDRDDANAGIYLNRFPVLRNGCGKFSGGDSSNNDYHESGEFKEIGSARHIYSDENEGVKIKLETPEGANHLYLINGCIYPVNRLLVYTENVQHSLASERMRFDVASLLPEMINNDIRRPMSNYSYGASYTRGFPTTNDYPYFDNMYIEPGSDVYYFTGYDRGWSNYQGDEINVVGRYDITLKLPPVPADGEYELRFGISSGSNRRSVAQFYFGTDKDNLQATGLTLDLRKGFVNHRFRNTTINSRFGYADNNEYKKEGSDRLVDLRLHEKGFLKGPNYFHCGNGTGTDLGMQCEWVTRRVIWRGYLEAGKTYYIRAKNCLDDTEAQFYMDYIEWCPKNVYDNPDAPEDIW